MKELLRVVKARKAPKTLVTNNTVMQKMRTANDLKAGYLEMSPMNDQNYLDARINATNDLTVGCIENSSMNYPNAHTNTANNLATEYVKNGSTNIQNCPNTQINSANNWRVGYIQNNPMNDQHCLDTQINTTNVLTGRYNPMIFQNWSNTQIDAGNKFAARCIENRPMNVSNYPNTQINSANNWREGYIQNNPINNYCSDAQINTTNILTGRYSPIIFQNWSNAKINAGNKFAERCTENSPMNISNCPNTQINSTNNWRAGYIQNNPINDQHRLDAQNAANLLTGRYNPTIFQNWSNTKINAETKFAARCIENSSMNVSNCPDTQINVANNLGAGCIEKSAVGCHSFAGGCNSINSAQNYRPLLPLTSEFPQYEQESLFNTGDCQFERPPYQVAGQQPSSNDGNFQGYQNSLYNPLFPSSNGSSANVCGTLNPSGCYKLPSSPESLATTPPALTESVSSSTHRAQTQVPDYLCSEKPNFQKVSKKLLKTSPTSTNTRSIAATNAAPAATNVLYNEQVQSLNFRNKTEFHGVCPEEQRQSCSGSSSSSSRFIPSTTYDNLLNSVRNLPIGRIGISGDNVYVDRNNSCLKEYSSRAIPTVKEEQRKLPPPQQESPVVPGYRLNNAGFILETGSGSKGEPAIETNVACTIAARNSSNYKQQSFCAGRSTSDASLVKHAALPHYLDTISPTSDIVTEMKYATQSGPPAAPPHLTSSGVEPPHSSQGSGIVVGSSPAEIDSLLLPWTNGPEFLDGGVPDTKQTAVGFQDNWDSILGTTVSEQSEGKLLPLPPFTNYTGHLQINGIPGHHYHTIASSGQRSSIEVGSASPTPSSNQEFFESPVVSSSTPCPQASQKQQQQQQQQQQNHQQPQHHHPHNPQQQQQLPQSTQQIIYEDMEDIAQIIGSAIADTTVPGNGNGPSSEQDTDASRDWIDIADWITDCSPKTHQETTSPSTFASHQIYVTTTPSTQNQQHAGSALQNLLTQKLDYAPLLQARLQSGNAANLQNASCGETPSSTSPFPPLSPPNRVSTSCSPDDILTSSFAAPSHPRKRSRPSPGSGGAPSKKGPSAGAGALPYGTESGLMSGKDKPIHRCHICQRGFLNKSNIKVHLRTHTGEKPFRCDVCSKAFRQKAHLIKHQQIHKRIGRD
ncbi:uncharacterized protein LOC105196378 [Solenopsis invicta]|uniref:uncharacterized protein LOC105196378 n=1 Tax=Solenopsis invicta TaxID=13686 RepID=UPI00193CA33A|nr:uncharacterized protein LOC105196378 [Solenopsis invicta]